MPSSREEMDKLLQEKFPHMIPMKGVPSLFTINGFGIMIYGRRDVDAETHTYVKSTCLTCFFVPVLWLAAYRVSDAGSNQWYFLGKEPLSGITKLWNAWILLTAISIGSYMWYDDYTHSPNYIAGQQVEHAEAAVAEKRYLEATKEFNRIASGHTSHAGEARDAARKVYREHLDETTAQEACDMVAFAIQQDKVGAPFLDKDEAFKHAAAQEQRFEASEPKAALKLLEMIQPQTPEMAAKREPLLKKACEKDPQDAEMASDLAMIYESRKEFPACKDLLAPLAGKLGKLEGARILGQLYAREEKFDEADVLLGQYCQERLQRLHQAEKEYNATEERIWNQGLADLRNGAAGAGWYSKYEAATKEVQSKMVNEYISPRFKNNHDMQVAEAKLTQEAAILPVALDLGIVMLRRAQNLPPDQRKKVLEGAEKTFLSIKGIAGNTDEYRISYGQVLYWLGRYKEGRTLFDEYLASKKDSFTALLEVSTMLRMVGSESECRELAEKAFAKATKNEEKNTAAQLRAIVGKDVDDKMLWLSKANADDPNIKASLASTRGEQAIHDGKMDEAEKAFREAIAIYENLPRSATSLNNAAVEYSALFRVTGGKDEFSKSVSLLEEAVALDPSDSILLMNLTSGLVGRGVMDIMGDEVDYKQLRISPDCDNLHFIYKTAEDKGRINALFRENKDIKKALSLLEKLLLLAPKRPHTYQSLAELYDILEKTESTQSLIEKASGVELDTQEALQTFKDLVASKDLSDKQGILMVEMKRRSDIYSGLKPGTPPVSLAIAASKFLSNLYRADLLGMEAQPSLALTVAGNTLIACRAKGTLHMQRDALLFSAHTALKKANASYAALSNKLRRTLSHVEVLAAGLAQIPELRAQAAAQPEFKNALGVIADGMKSYPEWASTFEWAILRHFDSDAAKDMAVRLKKDASYLPGLTIAIKLFPFISNSALRLAWYYEAMGEPAKAAEVMKECAKFGMPMP